MSNLASLVATGRTSGNTRVFRHLHAQPLPADQLRSKRVDRPARGGDSEVSLWHLSEKGDFQRSRQRKSSYFTPSEADSRLSLMALNRWNGPKCGLFRKVTLNKINNLYCMAEREGFEPPIALRLCLISSQVHSTGLCHLSALVNTAFSITSILLALAPAHPRLLPVPRLCAGRNRTRAHLPTSLPGNALGAQRRAFAS